MERTQTSTAGGSGGSHAATIGVAAPAQARSPDGDAERAPQLYQRLDTCAGFPYPLSEYVRKAAWLAVRATLFRWSPARVRWWRTWLLSCFGARIDRTCNIRPSVRIRHPWLLEMGAYSTLADDVNVYNLGPIRIGQHTVVSQHAHLCNGSHDYRHPSLPLVRPDMHIGSGVWICADAFIGPGASVGDNAIVGARAVVAGDVPAGMIVAGNPASVVRPRPAPDQSTTDTAGADG